MVIKIIPVGWTQIQGWVLVVGSGGILENNSLLVSDIFILNKWFPQWPPSTEGFVCQGKYLNVYYLNKFRIDRVICILWWTQF